MKEISLAGPTVILIIGRMNLCFLRNMVAMEKLLIRKASLPIGLRNRSLLFRVTGQPTTCIFTWETIVPNDSTVVPLSHSWAPGIGLLCPSKGIRLSSCVLIADNLPG